jgi:mgtE-like transporter
MVSLIGVSLFGGAIATAATIAVAYYTAVATYRLGMDPDNHGIPIITSSMDFVGVFALIGGLAVVGLGS